MLVEASVYDEVVRIAAEVGAKAKVGQPSREGSHIGPLVSKVQFEKVQRLIEAGVSEGCTLLCGGPGRPAGFERGYFAKPTIFADVSPDATISEFKAIPSKDGGSSGTRPHNRNSMARCNPRRLTVCTCTSANE